MNRNPDVDAWFAARSHPLDTELRAVRDIVLQADDRVVESIKWKTPTFSYKGDLASFSPAKNLVSGMFHRGAEIPGQHPELEGDARLVRTMRFVTAEDIDKKRSALQRVVRGWCDWKGSL